MNKVQLIVDTEISNSLLNAGIPANLQGYFFLKDAITECIKNPGLVGQLTKTLYPNIAKKYSVSSAIVERSIRHAIYAAYKADGLYGINIMLDTNYFNGKERPCNGCFISLIAEIVKKNLSKMILSLSVNNDPFVDDLEKYIGSFNKVTA